MTSLSFLMWRCRVHLKSAQVLLSPSLFFSRWNVSKTEPSRRLQTCTRDEILKISAAISPALTGLYCAVLWILPKLDCSGFPPGAHLFVSVVLSFKCNCLLCYFKLHLNVVLHFLFKVPLQPKNLLIFLFLQLNAWIFQEAGLRALCVTSQILWKPILVRYKPT